MNSRPIIAFALLSVSTAPLAHASFTVFTDQNAWKTAAGTWNSDNFASAPLGGPQPSYVSPLGLTLRRSFFFENNAQSRTTTLGYDGDRLVSEPPYSFESSPNRVFIAPSGPNPTDRIFAGVEDNYNRTDGFDQSRFTRLTDRHGKLVRTEYDDLILRSGARVLGEFEEAVFGFGFSLNGSAGPFPGTLRLAFEGDAATLPLVGFTPGSFFGVMSSTPIDDFRFSVSRATLVHSTEMYTNRICGFSPTEVCLGTGSLERWFATANANISQIVVAEGTGVSLIPGRDASLSTPEPSTSVGLITALAVLWRFRRRLGTTVARVE